jgi:hypothetical protein
MNADREETTMLNPQLKAQETHELLRKYMVSQPLLAEIREKLDYSFSRDIPAFYTWLQQHPDVISDPTLLIYVTTRNHKDVVPSLSCLLSLGTNINATNASGQTALHFVAQSGDKKALAFLLNRGAIQLADHLGFTPLHYAILAGHVEAIDMLMHHPGANIADTPQGETILQFAKKEWQNNLQTYGWVLHDLLEFKGGKLTPHLNGSDLVKLVNDEDLDVYVRQNAYYQLVASADLATLQSLLPQLLKMDERIMDASNKDIAIAIHEGREDVLRWLLKTVGVDLEDVDFNTVSAAIIGNQLRMLRLLLKSLDEGGFGLTLDAKDVVLTAIKYGRIAMLHELVKTSGHGFGLSLQVVDDEGHGPVALAIVNQQLDLLRALVTPVDKGGFGLTVTEQDLELFVNQFSADSDPDYYYTLCLAYFNQLLAKNTCEAACAWLNKVIELLSDHSRKPTVDIWQAMDIKKTPYPKEELLKTMIPRCIELLSTYLENQNDNDAHLIANFIEEIAPGAADLTLAHHYQQEKDSVAAFKLYYKCLEDNTAPASRKQEAGVSIAEMIYMGGVVLNPDGSLNEEQTRSGEVPASNENVTLEDLRVEKQDAQLSMTRAILAYEYLSGNPSDAAARLRARCDKTLVLQSTARTEAGTSLWAPMACRQFMNYYVEKNINLLTEPSFLASANQVFIATNPAKTVTQDRSDAATLVGQGVFREPQKKQEERLIGVDAESNPRQSIAEGNAPVSPPKSPGNT